MGAEVAFPVERIGFRARRRRIGTGFYIVGRVHVVEFTRRKSVEVKIIAKNVFSGQPALSPQRAVFHFRPLVVAGFRKVAFLVGISVETVEREISPLVFVRKSVAGKAEDFLRVFKIRDVSGQRVECRLLFSRNIIEAGRKRV